jgi:hypothetical protein
MWTTPKVSRIQGVDSKYLSGVKSSSHNSTPIQVSIVLITASPNGTLVYRKSQFRSEFVKAIYLVSDRLNQPRKKMVFPLAMFFPRGEMTELAVVAVIGQPHLGSNEDNLAIMNNDTAVVPDILVDNGPGRNISRTTRQPDKLARIPMSHTIPTVASDDNTLASTSQE